MRIVAGKAKGISLKTPDGMLTRPTADRVKEALFSIIQFDLPCAKVLDLFAGTGQLGIEALSRGAEYAVFVDTRKEACNLVRENLRRSGMNEQGCILQSDYKSFLLSTKEKFDIILLDPPYAEDYLENSLKIITEIDILQSGGIIIAERPVEKPLSFDFDGFSRSKDYKYGKTFLTVYRKD